MRRQLVVERAQNISSIESINSNERVTAVAGPSSQHTAPSQPHIEKTAKNIGHKNRNKIAEKCSLSANVFAQKWKFGCIGAALTHVDALVVVTSLDVARRSWRFGDVIIGIMNDVTRLIDCVSSLAGSEGLLG